MHRHGYKGPKFGRQRDQRRALLRGMADSLVLNGSLETTLPRAKWLRSYTEKLITKAKKGDIHARRQLVAELSTQDAVHKLVDDIAPKLKNRQSGYLRVKATTLRRGDGSQMATISFVDDLTVEPAKPAEKKPARPATSPKKAPAKEAN
jgi:large subunit ribosomal protein L17